MKKFFSCAAIAALSLAGLSSCSEDLEAPRASGMAGAIRFGLVQNNATKGVGTTSTNFLNQIKDFQVWAYYDGTATGEGVEPGDRYIGVSDTEGTFIDGDGKGTWRYRDELGLQYWPTTSAPLNFQAITPATDASFTISNTPADNLSHLTAVVNVPTDVKLQKDIMFAKADKQTYESNANCVSLMFNHSLSQVVFNGRLASNKITAEVSSIEIANVHSKGNVGYFASDASLGSEVTGVAETTYSLGIADDNIIDITTPKSLTSEDGALLMLPQNVTAWATSAGTPVSTSEADAAHNSYLKIKCTVTDNTSGTVLINDEYVYIPFEISWEQGKKYIYTLVFGDLSNGYDENGESLKNMLPITYTVTTGDEWEQVEGGEYGVGGEQEPEPDFTKMVKASYKGTAGTPTSIYNGDISDISVMYVNGKKVKPQQPYTDPSNDNFDVYFELKNPTAIAYRAFYYNSNLTSITIPEGVETIGQQAFYKCSGLTSVTIGNSVESIGDMAFNACTGLTSVHITDIAAWCNISFRNIDSNPLYYAHHLYLNGEEVKDLVIPEGVETIKGFAFFQCTGLTSITLPEGVKSLGSRVFEGCSSLSKIISNAPVGPTLNTDAFRNLPSGGTLTIPDNSTGYETWISALPDDWALIGSCRPVGYENMLQVTYNFKNGVSTNLFYDNRGPMSYNIQYVHVDGKKLSNFSTYTSKADGEKTIYFELGDATMINSWTFCGIESITNVVLPSSVTNIMESSFQSCSNLTNITLPEGLMNIGGSAFQSTGISEITIPTSVQTIGYSALQGTKLTRFEFHEGITVISNGVLMYCKNLQEVVYPSTTTKVDMFATYGCTSLLHIICAAPVAPTLERDNFRDVPTNGTLTVPVGATGYDAWLSKMPSGWTIEYSDEL